MSFLESLAYAVFLATMFHYAFVIWNPLRFKYKTLSQRIAAGNCMLRVHYIVFERLLLLSLPLVLAWIIVEKVFNLQMTISPESAILGLILFNVILASTHRRKIHIADIDGKPAVIRCNRLTAELHFLGHTHRLGPAAFRKLLKEGTKDDLLIALHKAGVRSYFITSFLLNRNEFLNRFSNHLQSIPANLLSSYEASTKKTSLFVSSVCIGLRIVEKCWPQFFKKLAEKPSLIFLCTMARELNQRSKPLWFRPIEKGFELRFH